MKTNAKLVQQRISFKWKNFLLPIIYLLLIPPAKADECPLPETSAPYIVRLSERAACYKQQENYPQAEDDYQKVVEIVKQDKTMSAATLAIAQTNLGKLYSDWSNHSDVAENLFVDSIKLFEKQADSNTRIVEPLISLGDLYLQQKKYAPAEQLYQRALGILRQEPAADPDRLSIALNNLAQHYRLQHRYAAADELFRESLALNQRTKPADQSSIATSYYNLAHNYQDWGRLADAEKCYQQALALRQQILLPQHPDIARILADRPSWKPPRAI
ncbi:MAG: tetratricopeptide repeat protein [Candidatus Thiothrix singaporensis]|uniref:Tetratricopeptide repeat protein n=1 Tax=Candidatus Thiothrix singaporensis TaxID=2799669 RepID=A0A7L6AV73_9GAMM|nr:MAG: tetratricopeptide repeat protein [Candidatus Thiothrix singaporensis]